MSLIIHVLRSFDFRSPFYMGRPAYAGSLNSKSHQNVLLFQNTLTYATVLTSAKSEIVEFFKT
jgi:hypothetical protein